jgi:penicillin-binding protein 2
MAEMEAVVSGERGTGKKSSLKEEYGIQVAGKTGTAQVVSLDNASKEHGDHAWFVGYAPAEKPEIVVAALIENGGHGGAVAAPVVKKVLQAYFYKNPQLLNPR